MFITFRTVRFQMAQHSTYQRRIVLYYELKTRAYKRATKRGGIEDLEHRHVTPMARAPRALTFTSSLSFSPMGNGKKEMERERKKRNPLHESHLMLDALLPFYTSTDYKRARARRWHCKSTRVLWRPGCIFTQWLTSKTVQNALLFQSLDCAEFK